MDARQALQHMRKPESLGVRTGKIDCFVIGDIVECDNPNGTGVVDVPCDEFEQRFAHNHFRKLTAGDLGQ